MKAMVDFVGTLQLLSGVIDELRRSCQPFTVQNSGRESSNLLTVLLPEPVGPNTLRARLSIWAGVVEGAAAEECTLTLQSCHWEK